MFSIIYVWYTNQRINWSNECTAIYITSNWSLWPPKHHDGNYVISVFANIFQQLQILLIGHVIQIWNKFRQGQLVATILLALKWWNAYTLLKIMREVYKQECNVLHLPFCATLNFIPDCNIFCLRIMWNVNVWN